MFSNQAVLSACLITLLGLVSTRLILRRENNPMVLSFTPTSHVNATAVHPLWGYHIAIVKHGSTFHRPEECSLR